MADRGEAVRESFVAAAQSYRRVGDAAEAERLLRDGLREQPDCAEGAAVLALVLLDQGRGDEARHALALWAGSMRAEASAADETPAGETDPFELSEDELERAFEGAETDRDQVFDADAVAQQAMRETDLDDLSEDLVAADSNFATWTIADLLEKQGDEQSASRIRAIVESSEAASSAPTEVKGSKASIQRLERWLANLRGGMQ